MMRRLRHYTSKDQHTERWLVSYADYMTIMFAFFVVLYAIAINNDDTGHLLSDTFEHVFNKTTVTQSQKNIQTSSDSVLTYNTPLGVDILYGKSIQEQERGPELLDGKNDTSNIDQKKLGMPLDNVLMQLKSALINEIRDNEASLELNNNWLVIELDSAMLFASGSAVAQSRAKDIVKVVSDIIAPINNFIRVRGYTDNQTIRNEIFSSNWELSVARATSILIEFERIGIESARMAIEGYGQYSPFANNDTEQGRAKNRKVVIALSKYGLIKPVIEVKKQDESVNSQQQKETNLELSADDDTIKIIRLPHGGIRVTTRNEQ